MAALLTSDIPGRNFKKKDSLVEHLEDCQRMAIEVTPPEVNRSSEFTVAEGKICFALSAIKGCGGAAAAAIVAGAAAGGPYRSLFDFCERLDPGTVNRRAVESLIKAARWTPWAAGGRNCWPRSTAPCRPALGRGRPPQRPDGTLRRRRGRNHRGHRPQSPRSARMAGPRTTFQRERGPGLLSLQPSPGRAREDAGRLPLAHGGGGSALKARSEVMLAGMISAIKLANTKNSKPNNPTRYAMFDLEDAAGMIRCILWPDQFVNYGELVAADAVALCVARSTSGPAATRRT